MLTNTLKKQRLKELVAHTSVSERKICITGKVALLFFSEREKKKRQTNTTDTNLNKEIRYIPGVE